MTGFQKPNVTGLEISGEMHSSARVFQGVHQLMGSDIGAKWGDETPGTKMVFIGVDLPKDAILKGLATCLA